MSSYTISKMEIVCLRGMRGQERRVTLEVGKEYKITPLDPRQKTQNTGRNCKILAIVVNSDNGDIVAEVEYTDDNQTEKVEPCDLKEVKPRHA
jgi:hypothetical protein